MNRDKLKEMQGMNIEMLLETTKQRIEVGIKFVEDIKTFNF